MDTVQFIQFSYVAFYVCKFNLIPLIKIDLALQNSEEVPLLNSKEPDKQLTNHRIMLKTVQPSNPSK